MNIVTHVIDPLADRVWHHCQLEERPFLFYAKLEPLARKLEHENLVGFFKLESRFCP
jgi:hypothetical protein